MVSSPIRETVPPAATASPRKTPKFPFSLDFQLARTTSMTIRSTTPRVRADCFSPPRTSETTSHRRHLFLPSQKSQARQAESSSPVIGIDLGTTFSCVAVWEGGRANVIANNMGNRTTPSWVSFQADTVFVGEAARAKASRNPHCTVYDAKRMIGRKLSDPTVQQSLKLWPFRVAEHRGNCAVVGGVPGSTCWRRCPPTS